MALLLPPLGGNKLVLRLTVLLVLSMFVVTFLVGLVVPGPGSICPAFKHKIGRGSEVKRRHERMIRLLNELIRRQRLPKMLCSRLMMTRRYGWLG